MSSSIERNKLHLLGLAAAAALTACGGDGGGSSPAPAPAPTPSSTTLSGVVASGDALGGATVKVIDSDTSTADPAAVTTDASGHFSIDVTDLKAPLVIQVTTTVQGTPTQLVALVPSVSAAAQNTTNVTPLTNAVAALVAPGGDPSALLSAAALAANVTATAVSNASQLIVNTLRTDPAIASTLAAGFDPLTTAFNADGTGVDGVLDKLDVSVSSAGVTITNLAAPVTNGNATAAVTLTAAQAATPTSVPTLPASATSSELPTASDVAALGAKIQACLTLPLSQRVTLDADGNVTAMDATCTFGASDFKSSGRNWMQQVGQYTFAKGYLSGATVGKGQTVLTLAPANLTGATEFKHPYCNSATCVVVRFPLNTPSGQTVSTDWMIAKTSSGWDFVGNQLPYNVYVEPRLNEYVSANATAAPSSTTNAYFFKSRFESRLRLGFDLNWGSTDNVRAVRFTGPGLPAAGVVEFRSQVCMTTERMAIVYQNGSTRVYNNTSSFQYWTGAQGNDFILDAANPDGSALATPTPVLDASTNTLAFQNFAPAPVADQSTLIPAWTVYKVEVFHYSALSDTPDEVIYVRTNSAAENAATGTGRSWPVLDGSAASALLSPTGGSAGALSSLSQSLSWTTPLGGYVGSAYLFGSDFVSATNSQNETANYGYRGQLLFDPATLGSTSVSAAYQWGNPASGTSLSSYTATSGTNPNPRCGSASVPALTATAGPYREIGLSFRDTNRKLYNAIWYWQN